MARNWAIAIGINEYENLPNLSYARRDAELMQNYFLNEVRFEQVYLFTDNSPEITDAGKPFKSQPKLEEVEPKSTKSKDKLQVFEFDVVTVEVQRSGFSGLGSKIILNRNRSQAKYFTEDLGNGVTLDMVYIPGGKFLMGTEDKEIERLCQKYNVDYFKAEKPQHEVTVEPFFMGKFQVTQAQWKAIASLPQINRKLEPDPSNFKDKYRPVEQISWDEAVEFCQRLSQLTGKGYRLPSEAEWEYACRAGRFC